MISARRTLLIAANLALAGAGAAVWTSAATPGHEERRAVARSPRSAPPASAKEPSSQTEAKPLFRVRPPAPAAVQEASPPSSPTSPNFRLAGVVWSDAEKVAIIQMTDEGRHRRLRLGETVGEWTLRELSARTALMGAGENNVRLTLQPSPTIDGR